MLVWLSEYLAQFYTPFSVFQYLTLRGIFSVITALIISWILGPIIINKLNHLQMGQAIREDGPQSHLSKAGTPTMGGVLILLAIFISSVLWADLSNRYVWLVLLTTLGFGIIGWVDDYRKVVGKIPRGYLHDGNIFGSQYLAFPQRLRSISQLNHRQKRSLFFRFLKILHWT